MKTLRYLSPTSISTFLSDKEQFYLRYLSDNRPERDPQTNAMSVGSAFDSEVKAELRYLLFGDNRAEVYEKYFTDSVDLVNRDFASVAGKRCFDSYKNSGALNDLMIDMSKAKEGPKFEFYVSNADSENGTINMIPDNPTVLKVEVPNAAERPKVTEVGIDPTDNRIFKTYAGGVKLLGKPDAWYITASGNHIILDWKVNGYCANRSVSPEKGYIMIRGGDLMPGMKGYMRGNGQPHKDAHLLNWNGTLIDCSYRMEEKNEDWARQLSIYSWLCGEGVGSPLIGAIDQLVASDVGHIRVAEHRCTIGQLYQFELFETCKKIWASAASPHYFTDMTLEQSQERCAQLDSVKGVMETPEVAAMYGRS